MYTCMYIYIQIWESYWHTQKREENQTLCKLPWITVHLFQIKLELQKIWTPELSLSFNACQSPLWYANILIFRHFFVVFKRFSFLFIYIDFCSWIEPQTPWAWIPRIWAASFFMEGIGHRWWFLLLHSAVNPFIDILSICFICYVTDRFTL